MMTLLYVAVGGALGSVARYLTYVLIGHYTKAPFPFATFTVNVLGGFLMGALVDILARFGNEHQPAMRALLAVGVMGGFTTFSTFSLDIVTLLDNQHYVMATVYVFLSVLLSVAALMGGMALMRALP
jgi:CrcB protein